jgi:cytidylate kinase
MVVVTMTREMGTLGKEVAAGLAEELDVDVVHSEIIACNVSNRLGIKESVAYRHLEGNLTGWDRWQVGRRRFLQGTETELVELAMRDNVIIRGWGAAQLLSNIANIACIRVCAPMEFRIEVMMKRLNEAANEASIPINHVPKFVKSSLFVSRDAAHKEIKQSDAEHAKFVRQKYATNWHDPANYDLVVNTGRSSVAECVYQIRQLIESPRFQNFDTIRPKLKEHLAGQD